MSKSFTPGPWGYQPSGGHHDFLIYAEADTRGRDLALVRDFDEANARLIAAAPDLLAALGRLADRVEQIELADGSTPDTCEARGLIARIRGEG